MNSSPTGALPDEVVKEMNISDAMVKRGKLSLSGRQADIVRASLCAAGGFVRLEMPGSPQPMKGRVVVCQQKNKKMEAKGLEVPAAPKCELALGEERKHHGKVDLQRELAAAQKRGDKVTLFASVARRAVWLSLPPPAATLSVTAEPGSVGADGSKPLHTAAWYGKTDDVKAPLTAKTDIEATNIKRLTPLHCAARNGHTEALKALLTAGADKEAKTEDGDTPLHCAAAVGHTEAVKALLTAGANKEAVNRVGYTPLHCAVSFGHTDVVKALLSAGASHTVSTFGFTPLQIATEFGGSAEMVNLVLAAARAQTSSAASSDSDGACQTVAIGTASVASEGGLVAAPRADSHPESPISGAAAAPLLHGEWEPAAGPPPPGGAVVKPDPEGGSALGPVGPVAATAAAAAAPPPPPLQQPLSPSLLRAVKAEPGGGSNGGGGGGGRGMAAGTARYVALAARPFDVAELAALQQHYMEEHTVEKDMSAATRRGTLRPNVRVARLRPAAESSYPQLWPHLQRLRRQVEAEAAAAAAAAGPAAAASMGGGGGVDDTAPSAAEALLFALRVLQEHGRLSGMEAGPRDAVLARVLPGYGAEVAAAARAATAAGLAGVEVVDLTAADEVVDVEEYVLQQPWVEAALKRVKIEE